MFEKREKITSKEDFRYYFTQMREEERLKEEILEAFTGNKSVPKEKPKELKKRTQNTKGTNKKA